MGQEILLFREHLITLFGEFMIATIHCICITEFVSAKTMFTD